MRFLASKIWSALACAQAAPSPGLWFFPARVNIKRGRGAFDTSALNTRRCSLSLQTNRRADAGASPMKNAWARISVIAMVITATMGAHCQWSRRRTRTLHTLLHDHCYGSVLESVDALALIMHRSQAIPCLLICSSLGHTLAWQHAQLFGASAIAHWCPLAPSIAGRVRIMYPYSPDQLQTDAILSCVIVIALHDWVLATTNRSCRLRSHTPICIPYNMRSLQRERLTEITTQRQLTCEHLDARLPSKNELRPGFLCACSRQIMCST